MKLERLNTWLGGVLGLVKGVLVCMVLTFFGVMMSEMSREVVFQSKSGKHLALLIERTGAFIPKESWQLLSDKIGEFNQKIRGDETTADILAQTEDDFARNSQVGQLFSQGSSLLNEVQSLRDGIQKEKDKASSFFDAVARWWKGDTAETATKTDTPPEPGNPPTLTTEQPAMLRSAVGRSSPGPDSVTPPPSLSSPAAPSISSVARQTSRSREDAAFMRRNIQGTTPQAPMDDLSSLLPASSQPAPMAAIPRAPVLQDSFSVESQVMSIPQSRGSFRVRNRPSGTATPIDRLLESGQAAPTRQPARLYRP